MSLDSYKLAVFDMDGVLTQPVSSWEFVHKKLGVDNTENLKSYRSGTLEYIDFLKSDVRLWLNGGGTTSARKVVSILDEIPLRQGVQDTFKILRDAGMKTAIVSGGIYWLAERVGKTAGADEIHANHIRTDGSDNIIADGVVMVDPRHKDDVVKNIQKRLEISRQETISVGDTLQDAAMFRNSGISFAFNPVDQSVSERATFTVEGNDLSAILDFIR